MALFEGSPQPLRVDAAWRASGLAALIEIHRRVEVTAGWPSDNGDALVLLVGKARGP